MTPFEENLLKFASGDYFLTLDGDDFYCDKHFVQDAINILEKEPSLIGCAFNFQFLYPDKIITPDQPLRNGIIDTDFYIKNVYIHSGCIVFRNIIDVSRNIFLKNTENFDDNLITIYMLQFGKLYYIDRPVYNYRQTQNSIWNNMTNIEKELVNAMSYEIMSRVAPEFDRCIFHRTYYPMKYIYKNKNILKNQLEPLKYQKYLAQSKKLKDSFIYKCLNWNNLGFVEKVKIFISWQLKKRKR